MLRPLARTTAALYLCAAPAFAQPVLVVDLAPSTAQSTRTFGAILGIHPLADGGVVVNDAGRRQLLHLDRTLNIARVVLDSASGTSASYGARPVPLISYLGDSALFVDLESASLLVLDPRGRVARSMAAPKPNDLPFLVSSAAYADAQGRLVYRGKAIAVVTASRGASPSGDGALNDSLPILRADFDTRRVDTIGRVKSASGTRTVLGADARGTRQLHVTVNPVQLLDEWAVLTDGSVAFLRGQDYHMDRLSPSGAWQRGPRVPYEWRRLSEIDKQRVVDSARAAIARIGASVFAMQESGERVDGAWGSTFSLATGRPEQVPNSGTPPPPPAGAPAAARMSPPRVEVVPVAEIGDYLPALRTGAARPDRAGNLWVLPTTSVLSRAGELVYDVLDAAGRLSYRVRVPVGRSVVGFGVAGVVYLVAGDRGRGFVLERSRVVMANP
ncbi:MAG: hypothetical protein IT353_00550 [Gemmatimonadaceae bacterium]|nr:hypothetical protein [Gemmatimonadaceae bacterium]